MTILLETGLAFSPTQKKIIEAFYTLEATRVFLKYNLEPKKEKKYVRQLCKWYKKCLALNLDTKRTQHLHMELAKHYVRFGCYLQARRNLSKEAYIRKYPQKHLKKFLKLQGCTTCQKSDTDTKLKKCKKCQMS